MILLIIADDFTGALDTGVQFAAHGVSTRVIVDPEVDFSAYHDSVLVIDTETPPPRGRGSLRYRCPAHQKSQGGRNPLYLQKDRFRSQRKHRSRACSGSHRQRL